MSEGHITVVRRLKDGTFVRVLSDGSVEPMPEGKSDWAKLDAMTDEEIQAAARSDPDNPPKEDYPPGRLKRIPRTKTMRRVMRLTQEEFSARFQIPLGTLRDWEQEKSKPDAAAWAYLKVIARNAEAVMEALGTAPSKTKADSDRTPFAADT